MSQDTVPTRDEHAPRERPLVRAPQRVHDPHAGYAAREEFLRQHGYSRRVIEGMSSTEVFTRIAQIRAFQELNQRKEKDQAFFQRHQARAKQPQQTGSGLSVPGMEEAGAWL